MSKPYYLKLLDDGVRKPLKLAWFTCERCGKRFQKEFWYIKKGRRFCSHECRKQDPMKTLLSKMEKQNNGCWNWTGCLGFGGYGQLKVGKKHWLAHRLMWVLHNKKRVPSGMVVRHTCVGNRKCINPEHLEIGTQKDNIHDMIRQGRFRADRPGNRIVSNNVVLEIRRIREQTNISYRKMSKMFNLGCGMIWQIVNGKSYKDVK